MRYISYPTGINLRCLQKYLETGLTGRLKSCFQSESRIRQNAEWRLHFYGWLQKFGGNGSRGRRLFFTHCQREVPAHRIWFSFTKRKCLFRRIQQKVSGKTFIAKKLTQFHLFDVPLNVVILLYVTGFKWWSKQAFCKSGFGTTGHKMNVEYRQ